MGFIREFIEEKEKQIIGNSNHILKFLEENWNQFILKDTYLIYDLKEKWLELVSDSSKISKIPWYLFWHVKLKKRIYQNLEKIHDFKDRIVEYNTDFIKRKKKEYAFLFKKDNLILDDDQQTAIITDDKHNLVVAGAGSGKTEVLTARIAYLVKRTSDTIKPERILSLAFQNKAANEIQQRLKQRYNIDVEIRTFHSLGKKIINEAAKTKGIKPPRLKLECAEDWKFNHYIKTMFDVELYENKQLQDEIIAFMKRYDDTQIVKTQADFKEKEEFYTYQRNLQYTTLDGSKVKSEAERDIMNFFRTHKLNGNNIKILYEHPAEWMKYIDEEGEEYIPQPDFYFPDFDIYLEHWAIGKNGTVPEWFSGENPTQEYTEHMNLKKEQYALHNKPLIETSQTDIEHNNLDTLLRKRFVETLQNKYPNQTFEFTPLSYHELVEHVWTECKEFVNTIQTYISRFIVIAKTYRLYPNDINNRLQHEKWSPKQYYFAKIAKYHLHQISNTTRIRKRHRFPRYDQLRG